MGKQLLKKRGIFASRRLQPTGWGFGEHTQTDRFPVREMTHLLNGNAKKEFESPKPDP